NNKTTVPATCEDGYIVIEANHFSPYEFKLEEQYECELTGSHFDADNDTLCDVCGCAMPDGIPACTTETTVLCFAGSAAETVAAAHGLNTVVCGILAKVDSGVDYDRNLIFTEKQKTESVTDLVLTDDLLYTVNDNKGNNRFVGTGTTVSLTKNNNVKVYTIIAHGDVNGDGICDALDASRCKKILQHNATALDNEVYAIAGSADAIVPGDEALYYQNIVNISLNG
ncbi:MAG: hypothetical protein II738_00770, partial [Clostridia bacterium]|nr:hypothetical protein [Clostridia bacterium]